MEINDDFLESLPISSIITDSDGKILKVKNLSNNIINNNKNNKNNICNKNEVKRLYEDNGFKVNVQHYKIRCDNKFYHLYTIDNTKYKIDEMDIIFNCIDGIVMIVNRNRVIEKVNSAFYKLTGIHRKFFEGKSIDQLKKDEFMEESIILKVFQSKKPLSMNVKYKSGRIVTYTAIPIIAKNGVIQKVIATGRNITNLVQLQDRLAEVEKQKNKYIDRLKNLEKSLGENIVYSSDKMKQVIKMAIRAAKTDSPIFITGESGVGKEEIAKFIHENSERNNKNFITVNCAAIPSELFESELFGYEDGAFTGAKKGGRRGLFEDANGGTIFLDEIGEMSLSMQTKLLRVLQENEIKRLGGNKSIKISVRYICATNLSKKQLSNNLKFRQDLYYRLSVIPINIPPLRERREAIFPLVHVFLNRYNRKYNRKVKLDKKMMEFLHDYNWPGNIRELKNVVERIVILSENDSLSEKQFWYILQLGSKDISTKNNDTDDKIVVNGLMNLNKAHDIIDETMIQKALDKYSTVTGAAKAIGIDPSTIYRRLKKHK
ncbi:sigma 54-interacting transcriptional regulator [Clostridium tyrobutyricum]|jgi:PAS domain S-box-containing protein|uniref:sigma-54 interaction domain-containing protein n=1 Tax=Clostridium tyrobutyricum TaxID=1519 RepID=UPI00057EE345|nr:sigma 54-interacting transcriptional regulator [Clostridium tyrobutyricum]MBV4423546.1 sigma 54-interacting transcriptional regulator [Clostridium tyrobutyricum]MBV4426981.1 sigma 54-interacting transcriptional regulator [Clostridium tyrobutyricum]MBV4444524.1 sigma 54-interacting transcriptional regulator [Clostridium tyrobutyricum]MBV4447317.1 sigma 54-interacting transcriptional regulator [Clostridium tyrobutyricum]MBV4448415.1 sigma 54-interacting transcriptional regulator [Clostridium 